MLFLLPTSSTRAFYKTEGESWRVATRITVAVSFPGEAKLFSWRAKAFNSEVWGGFYDGSVILVGLIIFILAIAQKQISRNKFLKEKMRWVGLWRVRGRGGENREKRGWEVEERATHSVTHSPNGSCATFLFLPHFDVICDLLLNRRTATWNLFIKLSSHSARKQQLIGLCRVTGSLVFFSIIILSVPSQ